MEPESLGRIPYIFENLKMNCANKKFNQGFKSDKDVCQNIPQVTLCGMNTASPFYLIDWNRKFIVRVRKEEFKAKEGPVVVFKNAKFKLISGQRVEIMPFIHSREWKTESLFSIIKDMVGFGQGVTNFMTKTLDILQHDKSVKPLLLDVFSLYVTSITPTYSNWTPTYLIGFLCRITSVCLRIRDLPYRTESIDSLLLATLSMGMPSPVVEILRRMSLLTSKKIFDSPNIILDIFGEVCKFLLYIFDWIPGLSENVKNKVRQVLSLGYKYEALGKVRELLDSWKKKKSVMTDMAFRKEVRDLHESIISDDITLDYVRSGPSAIKIRWEEFVRLHKSVDSYESCSRKEPVCIVFEGPPGCRKTVASVKITEVLGKSTYVHTVKSVDDGKDFYDGYNGEEIFVMDDVGQQGASQWRTIINMVSSLKLPLECASVDLKDTKYFNSDIILLTTNQFMDLTFTRSDCINDRGALMRRGHVFKYENNGCRYYRWDIKRNRFVSEYPEGLKTQLPLSFDFPNGPGAAMNPFVVWTSAWVCTLQKYYEDIYKSITCTEREKLSMREMVNELLRANEELNEEDPPFEDAQDWVQQDWGEITTSCLTACSEALDFAAFYFGRIIRKLSDLVMTGVDLLADKPVWEGLSAFLIAAAIYNGALGLARYMWNGKDTDVSAVDTWRASLKHIKKVPIKISGDVPMIAEESVSTMLDAIKKHMAVIKIHRVDGSSPMTQCLVSGHFILIPAHMLYNVKPLCTIYSSYDAVTNDWRALDSVPYEIIFKDDALDIALLSLPKTMLTPFKKANQYFKVHKGKVAKLHIVTCDIVVDLSSSVSISPDAVKYRQVGTEIMRTIEDPLVYGISCPGLCGALIVDPDVGIVGMHLTGNGVAGAARVFSQSILDKLRVILEKDANIFECEPAVYHGGIRSNLSGQYFKTPYHHSPQSKTHLKPSEFAGLQQPTKYPANLQAFGPQTVSVRAERFQKPQKELPQEELDFTKKVFEVLVDKFTPISEAEVIKGNKDLPPLNKKSVNGYFFPKNKEEYVDYDTGQMRPEFKETMEDFRRRILSGDVKIEDVMMYEALKDELRVEGKVDKPRTFTIDNLLSQFEMKRLMGGFFQQIVKDKWFNQIMIGMNPYKDWNILFNAVKDCPVKWDADIGEWDAHQLSALQDCLHNVVLSKFQGSKEDHRILEFLLENSVRSWVLVLNKLVYSTHGMKSGKWITALFNSLYNRGYTACWYYRVSKQNGHTPTVSEFLSEVKDFVLGDDKLCAITQKLVGYKYPFDAFSMRDFFESIGMTFTDGAKQELVNDKPVEQLSFLKRNFRFHTELGMVGPLSMETIENTVLWVDGTKDEEEVMQGKLAAVQRELYLHENVDFVDKLEKYSRDNGITMTRLPKSYLFNLFKNEPDYAYLLFMQQKGLQEGIF